MLLVEKEKRISNEEYCKSPEWLELLEKAGEAVNQSYTIIYRDTDQELKEAWHWLSDMNMDYIKEKYKKQKREILYLEPMTMKFGAKLALIKGNSKADR